MIAPPNSNDKQCTKPTGKVELREAEDSGTTRSKRKVQRMKASKQLQDKMRRLIEPFDTFENRECYRQGDFARADRVKDLNKRYRWDLFWAANASNGHTFYQDLDVEQLNDAHVDTVLRSIVTPLEEA